MERTCGQGGKGRLVRVATSHVVVVRGATLLATPSVSKYKNIFDITLVSKTFL